MEKSFEEQAEYLVSKYGIEKPRQTVGYLLILQALKDAYETGRKEATVGFIETGYTLDDAITDLSGVQLVDNTSKDADLARKEIEEIFCKLDNQPESMMGSR